MKKQIAQAVKARMKELGETYITVGKGSGVSTKILGKIITCKGYEINGLDKIFEYLDLNLVIKK